MDYATPTDTRVFVFRAPSRMVASEITPIRQQFDLLLAQHTDVIFDLRSTEVIDGSGVGAIVYAFKRLAAAGHKLTLRNVRGQPHDLLQAAGAARAFGIGERAFGARTSHSRLRGGRSNNIAAPIPADAVANSATRRGAA